MDGGSMSLRDFFFLIKFLFYISVKLIYNIVLVSVVWLSDSVYAYIHPFSDSFFI